jgi:hypothetical protein
MWVASKDVETGIVHAVSLLREMSPHGFAIGWPMEETKESLNVTLPSDSVAILKL